MTCDSLCSGSFYLSLLKSTTFSAVLLNKTYCLCAHWHGYDSLCLVVSRFRDLCLGSHTVPYFSRFQSQSWNFTFSCFFCLTYVIHQWINNPLLCWSGITVVFSLCEPSLCFTDNNMISWCWRLYGKVIVTNTGLCIPRTIRTILNDHLLNKKLTVRAQP